MPPLTKLTAEQMMDITTAIHLGLSNAQWEGIADRPWPDLNRKQRQAILTKLKAEAVRIAAEWRANWPGNNGYQNLPARYELETIELAEKEEPAKRKERIKNLNPTITGCKQAMNDILSQATHFSAAQIRAVDRRLAAKQLPSLRELSGKLNRVRAGILKSGKIRTDAEFYVVKEIVCDQASDVTEAERTKFEILLDAYEQGLKP